jgi:crossover junction endodeoxyribonuclease RuvC
MIVLGIDPGTAVTGFGVVTNVTNEPSPGPGFSTTRSTAGSERLRLVACGVVRTQARKSLASRLHEIHSGVTEVIARYRPDVLAVEGVFYARNARTTLALGHARGVVLLAGVEAGLAIREYSPAEIKKCVVGTGAATKEQVQFMLTRLLRLKTPPHPADAADGVAAAVACMLTTHMDRVTLRGDRNDVETSLAAVRRRISSVERAG